MSINFSETLRSRFRLTPSTDVKCIILWFSFTATFKAKEIAHKEKMSHSKKRVHLFNCDNTYKLEPVEKLLEKCGSHVEYVEKHSFRLAKMSEMVGIMRT